MIHDAESWWLVAGIITGMVSIISLLLSLLAKYLMLEPMKELKSSIIQLTNHIHELNTFIALQKQENSNHKATLNDIFDELEKHDGVFSKQQAQLDKHKSVLELHDKELKRISQI